MFADSAFKNLLPELHFLIFNGSSISILGRLRCVCKKFSLCTCLKNILDTHQDHARIRFEKVVYTAKPFFPEKMKKSTISEDMDTIDTNILKWKDFKIAKKIVGLFYNSHKGEIAYWAIHCRLSEIWCNFFYDNICANNINYKKK